MFSLQISTGNAAFGSTDNDVAEELSQILKELAKKLSDDVSRLDAPWGDTSRPIYDTNGNQVGSWRYRPT